MLNLLAMHQMYRFCSSLLAVRIKSFGFFPVIDKLASSQNNEVEKIFEMFGKSFMYKRKRIGPNTLPCGTPARMEDGLEI